MRPAPVGAAIVLVALLLVPYAATAPHAVPPPLPRVHSASTASAPWVAPPSPATLAPTLFRENRTYPASGTPVSAYQETPPPPVPSTVPTVVHVVTNGRGCCYYVNQTPAGGPWDSVVLNYTGTIVGGVYDSSYHAFVGGAQVLFGTTPEYGTWTVLQNLTEYESLLRPGANFTFILSAALAGGYFESTVTLSFYPPPTGGPVPSEPNRVVPLWSLQFVKPSAPTISANATVPANASAVVLRLWTYAFGPNGGDEFWWTLAAPQRAVELSLDGAPLAAVYPFPYVNTGGVDLFLWRPIAGSFTLSDRPYDVNLTGALGKLDGSHEFNASILDRNAPDPWLVEGSLLIWTSPNVTGATSVSGSTTFPSPMTSGGTVSSTTSFSYQSNLATSAGPVPVSSIGSGSFRETETTFTGSTNGTSWQNLSQSSSFNDATTAAWPNATSDAYTTRNFAVSVDMGSSFLESSARSGGYPLFGNATVTEFAYDQSWNELDSGAYVGPGGQQVAWSDALTNEIPGADGVFLESLEYTSATAGSLIGIAPVQSSTAKYTAEQVTGLAGTSGYAHEMSGAAFHTSDPNFAETLLENRYTTFPAPLTAAVGATSDPVDVGASTTLVAQAHGGAGALSYSWSSLPPGCTAANSPQIGCVPTTAGTYTPSVEVADSAGDIVLSAPGVVVVAPALNATVAPTTAGADVGSHLAFTVAIVGGTPPYNCTWSIGGAPSTSQDCASPASAPTSIAGPVSASVSVRDGTGAVFNTSSAPVTVHGAMVVRFTDERPNAVVGDTVRFSTVVTGGTPPISYEWMEGSSVLAGFNGSSIALVPNATGTLSVNVVVSDAAGVTIPAGGLTTYVNASSNGTGSGGSTSGGSNDLLIIAVLALAAVAGVEAILLVSRRIPPRPPSRRA